MSADKHRARERRRALIRQAARSGGLLATAQRMRDRDVRRLLADGDFRIERYLGARSRWGQTHTRSYLRVT